MLSKNSNEHSSVSLSGYLWKMKRNKRFLTSQWTKRWFSIEGKDLKWYSSSQNINQPSNSIDLYYVTYISRFEMNKTYSFIINHRDRNLMIRAENLDTMEKWIRALQQQIDSLKNKSKINNQHNSLENDLDNSLKELIQLENTTITCTSTSKEFIQEKETSDSKQSETKDESKNVVNDESSDLKYHAYSRIAEPRQKVTSNVESMTISPNITEVLEFDDDNADMKTSKESMNNNVIDARDKKLDIDEKVSTTSKQDVKNAW